MKLHARIVAGTALGVLMASSHSWADERLAAGLDSSAPVLLAQAPVLLAQANVQTEEELEEDGATPTEGEEQPAAAEEAAPAAQPAPAEEAPPAPQAAEPAAEDQPAEAQPEATPEPQPDAPAPAEEPQPDAAPAVEPAEAGDMDDEEPVMEAPEVQPEPQDVEPEVTPEPDQPAEAEAPVTDAPAVEPQPSAEEVEEEAPAPEEQAEQPAEEQPAGETPEEPTTGEEAPAPSETPAPTPGTDEPAPMPEGEAGELPENAAPVLDSAKQPAGPEGEQPVAQEAPDGQAVEQPVGPPPTSDQEAQPQDVAPTDLEPITATEGRRIDRDEYRRGRDQRPEGAEVLREIGERIIYQLGGETFVQGPDRGRLERDATEVYYEELPRGRVRETIVRPNGVQIVTVRNRFGDVIRRSRVMPDGREVLLTYVDARNYDRERTWRDPGRDLPPLQLSIPYREYILDAERVEDPDRYYQFLDQPPVERARQLYSVDDVKRSARLRDTVRRVDLDTITFPSGSAEVSRSEVSELEGIASAMERMLNENPAETFLIEGHTDAVGSEVANLALSDARAESVADALTRYYDIPPENLVTQGYGERYLKISTEGPSRENRRVSIRRITPLVTPIASAQ